MLAPGKPAPAGSPPEWSLDGLAPGMSYREVLGKRGPPKSVHWVDGCVCLTALDSAGRHVWFRDGKLIFCGGTQLARRGQILVTGPESRDLGLEPRAALEKALGKSEELDGSRIWWPDSGVTLRDGVLIGLRAAPQIPEEWADRYKSRDPRVIYAAACPEPWQSDVTETWSLGGRSLGSRRASGWVRRLEGTGNLEHRVKTVSDEVVSASRAGAAPPFRSNRTPVNGWWQVNPQVSILMKDGKCQRFVLDAKDPELFEALDEITASSPPDTSDSCLRRSAVAASR